MISKWGGDIDVIKTQLLEKISSEQLQLSKLEAFGKDKHPSLASIPDIVVHAETNDDVQWVCKTASQFKVPLTIRGAGTNNTGASIPVAGGIVLTLDRMTKILELDLDNTMIHVQAGVITAEIQKAADNHNLFYPPDPQSQDTCTIGGNVAQNAGGPRAVKYGVTSHYVLGLKGYYIDGTPFSFGGKQLKNVAGYNMLQLLIGSEGTLGIVTEIMLKLRVKPKYRQDFLVAFTNYHDAVAMLRHIHTQHIEPAKVEFIDGFCFEASAVMQETEIPYQDYPASLLIECDGYTTAELSDVSKELNAMATLHNATLIETLDDPKKREWVWNTRMSFSEALSQISLDKKSEDVVVPPSQIPDYLNQIQQIGQNLGLKILGYGHLGDGNIHVNILNLGQLTQNWDSVRDNAVKQVMEAAVACGGTITGEHGVGLSKKDYLSLVSTEKDIAIMRQIKAAFDPDNLLNPGKIF